MAQDQLVEDVRTLSADLQAGLTNLHGRIASLKVDAADAPALQEINHLITGLIERAQHGDAQVRRHAPESDAPDETTVPVPMETPETPAALPKSRAKNASSASED